MDVPVRCPMDTNGDGVSDRGGCDDARVFSNGTNFMSLYELDPGTPDDLVQTIYFPATPVSLTCSAFGCTPVRSDWVTPNAYDSPTSPAKVSAQFALAVNSAVFVDTARSCRAIGPALETVTAASFRGQGVAPESIASVFGEGLAIATANAGTVPLPLELSGSSVAITDSVGASRAAPLFYVSPGQINFQVPPGTATGAARIVVSRSDTVTSRGSLQIIPVSPDLFAANANGEGVAAASALRLNANGIAEAVPVFQCGPAPLSCIPTPIELGARPTYLTLYGTGLRGAANRADVTAEIGGIAAEILYAGPQPRFIGLDQVNLVVPATLRGRGVVEIRLTIGARVSNPVTIAVR